MGSNEKRKIVANEDGNSSSQPHSPKRRIIGPSLPSSTSATTAPGEPLSDRESDSESDDDFGPTLPPSHDETGATAEQSSNNQTYLPDVHQKKESQRDQWMLQPPDQSNWASKIDPTQIRNRKFQTGRSARSATSKQVDASWMESPEERMRRLGDEVMGVGASSDNSKQSVSSADAAKAKLMEDKIKKFNVSTGSLWRSFVRLVLRVNCIRSRQARKPVWKLRRTHARRMTIQAPVHLIARRIWQSPPGSPMLSAGKWSTRRVGTTLALRKGTSSRAPREVQTHHMFVSCSWTSSESYSIYRLIKRKRMNMLHGRNLYYSYLPALNRLLELPGHIHGIVALFHLRGDPLSDGYDPSQLMRAVLAGSQQSHN